MSDIFSDKAVNRMINNQNQQVQKPVSVLETIKAAENKPKPPRKPRTQAKKKGATEI